LTIVIYTQPTGKAGLLPLGQNLFRDYAAVTLAAK